jgi:TonB family protein
MWKARTIAESLLWLVAVPVCLGTVDPADQQLLASSSDLVNIRSANAKPFQLEADIRLQINVPQDGHFTWKWAAKDLWVQEIILGDYRQTNVRNADTLYISRNGPFTPLRISELQDLVNVFSADAELQIKKIKHEAANGTETECIEARARPGRHVWNPKRELCINRATKEIVSDEVRDDQELRSKEFTAYEPFREHRYPRQLKLLVNGSAVVKIWVTSLQDATFDESTFVPPPGAIARRQCEHMIHPVPVKTPDPVYPRSAVQNRIGGTVTLAVSVLPDGSVSDVHLIGGAGHEMDEVTRQTVKKWKFKPAMCGNEPVSYDLQVEVNFRTQ